MEPRKDLLAVTVALIISVATAAGLVALTSWPRSIVLTLALFLGAAALLIGILFFGHPVDAKTKLGRRASAVLGALAFVSALVLSFSIGLEVTSAPTRYPFFLTTDGITLARSFPADEAGSISRSFEPGETVWVYCFTEVANRRWYMVGDVGWLRDDELVAAPHTGRGSPPRCPD